jgi:hypothetical protein
MSHERRVWRVIAFLARYGHQQAAGLMDFPLSDLRQLQECVGELMDDEARATKRGLEGG